MKCKFIFATLGLAMLLGFNSNKSFAQVRADNSNYVPSNDTTISNEKPIRLGEIEISSSRINRKLKEIPASLNVTDALTLQKKSDLSLAYILNYEPGVAMGGDGVWSTYVNVRGLGEQRLVTLVDGDRVETATDLTASLSMIDVNDIDRVEIVKGAQSVLYGTGAMGGIVNVITKDGHFADKPYVSGNVTSAYSTVNHYTSNNISVNTGAKRWYLRLSGSYGKAGNIMTPEGEIPNSQFITNNIAAKAGFNPFKNHVFKVQFQRNWSTNVGIPGGSAFPGPATAKYKDIGRTLFDGSYEITNISEAFTSLKIKYYHQNIRRDVVMYPNTVTYTNMPNGNIQYQHPDSITPNAIHVTNGAQLQTTWQFGSNNTLIAGVDFFRRDMVSDREKYVTMQVLKPDSTLVKENKIIRYETPVPTSSFTNGGIFLQDESHLFDNKMTLTVGARADLTVVSNEMNYDVDSVILNGALNPAVEQRIIYQKNKTRDISWSANIGMLYKLGASTDLVFNIARSYRAPSLEERFKYIDLGNYVRLGDPNLKPEHGYSADLGLRVWGNKFSLQSSVYVNRLTDMITEVQGIFVYNTAADVNTYDTLPALINTNIAKALLYGFDFQAQYNVIDNLMFTLTGSYVRGRDTYNKTDLPLIPPLNGSFTVSYTYPKVGNASVTLWAVNKQDKIAEGEKPTDGYFRLDFALNTREFHFWKVCGFQLFAGIDNITNTAYTNHLSTNRGSISVEPGRNFYVRGIFTF